VEEAVAHRRGKIAPRRVEVELELPRERGEHDLAQIPDGSPHGSTTPSRIEMRGSPSTSSSLTRRRVPSPPQVGHAPKGELKEKWRGSSSGMEMPQTGQPYFSEKVSTVPVVGVEHLDEPLGELERRLDGVGETAAIVGAHDERSTTTEIE
jgi:hypothetical protein